MIEASRASRALDALGISHKVFRHAGQVLSIEQAAKESGQRAGQIVRSMLFRLGPGDYLMALVAGPEQISWKKLRRVVDQPRLSMASEAEVLEIIGYRIGTVSPFGLQRPIRILIDPGVLEESAISVGAGVPNTGIVLSTVDLLRALPGAVVVQLLERH